MESKRVRRAILGALLLVWAAWPAHAMNLSKIGEIRCTAIAAALHSPSGFWHDGFRDLFIVAYPLAHKVVLLDRQGNIRKTLGSAGELLFPRLVAADKRGTLYVGGRDSETITVYPEYDSAAGEEFRKVDLLPYRLSKPVQPSSLFTSDKGQLYIADRGNRQLIVFDSAGTFSFSVKEIGEPADIAVDRSGKIFVSDLRAGGVRVYSESGKHLRTVGTAPAQFREPVRALALAVDARERIWALGEGVQGIAVIDPLGNLAHVFRGGELIAPVDIAVDLFGGNLYVLEEGGNRISVFRVDGI